MATVTIDWPVQLVRQYAKPMQRYEEFETTAARNAYLTNPLRYAGQRVYDIQADAYFRISKDRTSWLPDGAGGETTTVTNGGTGFSLIDSATDSNVELKSLIAGNNFSIVDDGNGNLTLSSTDTDTDTGEVNTASGVGTGTSLVFGKQEAEILLKSLVVAGSLTLSESPDGTLTITGNGQINTASNKGAAGVGLYDEKVGSDLRFKKLVAGANTSIVDNGDGTVTVTAVGPDGGENNTLSSAGTGTSLFYRKVGADLQTNSLKGGTNIGIVDDGAGTLTVNYTGTPEGTGALESDLTIVGGSSLGMKEGETLPAGMTFDAFARKWLIFANPITYTGPSLSLSVSGPANVVEAGETVDISASAIFEQNDAGAASGVSFKKGGVSQLTDSTAPYTYDPAGFVIGVETVNYQATATYAQGPIKNDALGDPYPDGRIEAGSVDSEVVTIKGTRAGFFGVDNASNSSTAIRALGKKVLDMKAGDKILLDIPAGSTKVTFALPANFNAPSSVVYVEGNVQVKGNFDMTTGSVSGANGYVATSYEIYTYVPAAPFVGQCTYEITIA